MYLPKSKVKTGLYSNGDLVYKSSEEPYYGAYFETYDGKCYVGDNPNNNALVELTKDIKNSDPNSQDEDFRFKSKNSKYSKSKSIKKSSPNPQLPKYYKTSPPEDTLIYEYTRYFAKRTNSFEYLEISKETYNNLVNQNSEVLWSLYECDTIQWSVHSQRTNFNLVKNIEVKKNWYGFSSYFNFNL